MAEFDEKVIDWADVLARVVPAADLEEVAVEAIAELASGRFLSAPDVLQAYYRRLANRRRDPTPCQFCMAKLKNPTESDCPFHKRAQ